MAEQARVLLQSILLGAGLGLVYDVLRALRRSLGWRWLAFLLDLLFWLGTIALLFFMALTRETGQLRLYLPAAFLLGGGVYLLTLSRLVLPLLLKILAALGKFWRWSTEPARKGGRLAKKVWKKRKKDFQNWKGRAILIYTTVAESDWDLCHTGWHELGHILTKVINKDLFIEAENDVNAMHDTQIRSGMAVWSEFIAEYIAILIDDEEPQPVAWPKQDILANLIQEATGSGSLNPYPLAFYCAMMMGDNTIDAMMQRQHNAAIGLDECDDMTGELIVGLLKILDEQLCQEEFWNISREMLEKIGAQIDELWSHCYYSTATTVLEKILKRKK